MQEKISYQLKRSKRAKNLRLTVRCNAVTVTAPIGVSAFFIDRFVKQKASWIKEKLSYFKGIDNSKIKRFSKKDYIKHKAEAFDLLNRRVLFFSQKHDFVFNNLRIKNQKTRWGSCSGKGNINLNYKIMFLPQEVQDYIIVHELCHLKEMNHSKRFWSLVEEIISDYKSIKSHLRKTSLYFQ